MKMPTTGQTAAGHTPVGITELFGAESTQTEDVGATPTSSLMWKDGTLMQMWEVEERRLHYTGKHYNHSTWHKRTEWRPVPGAPNARPDAPGQKGQPMTKCAMPGHVRVVVLRDMLLRNAREYNRLTRQAAKIELRRQRLMQRRMKLCHELHTTEHRQGARQEGSNE